MTAPSDIGLSASCSSTSNGRPPNLRPQILTTFIDERMPTTMVASRLPLGVSTRRTQLVESFGITRL